MTVYISLIRSVLEYCCAVWHHALPAYFSESLERVQKRALRTIAPTLSYSEALSLFQLPRLDSRRSHLCEKILKKIFRGGALLKHLPDKREDIHNYQIRSAKDYSRRDFAEAFFLAKLLLQIIRNLPNFFDLL